MKLHAPDKVGGLASDAANFASILTFNLLAASSATLPPAKRLESMERAFFVWSGLCRRMAELEAVAPNSARAGADQAAAALDFIEAQTAKVAA